MPTDEGKNDPDKLGFYNRPNITIDRIIEQIAANQHKEGHMETVDELENRIGEITPF